MVDICWSERGGWHRPRVQPYGPISLDPAASVLHYAQEIFEGLKAYRHADGSIWTFRPDQNAARMQRSARAPGAPRAPGGVLPRLAQAADRRRRRLGAHRRRDEPLLAAVHVREGGVPRRASGEEGQLLPDREPRPVPTSAGGITPLVDLALDHLHPRRPRRHGPGQDGRQLRRIPDRRNRRRTRTGASRCSSSTPQKGEYLEELGGMNVVLVTRDNRLITPDCDSILEGITLDSILQLGATAATRSSSARSPSTSGGRASPPARSSRRSHAAPLP